MKNIILKIIVGLFILAVFIGLVILSYWWKPGLVEMLYTILGGIYCGKLVAKFTEWLCKKLGL
jgi:hypothetical protein